MKNNHGSGTELPIKVVQPDNFSVSTKDLLPRSDLTYRKIERLAVNDLDLEQSLLAGSLMRRCVWTRVKFRRSDLDGLRAEKCDFIECDFTTCDVRSSYFNIP
jgi:uncharacterized protein YjbI with pentapeptide repeats